MPRCHVLHDVSSAAHVSWRVHALRTSARVAYVYWRTAQPGTQRRGPATEVLLTRPCITGHPGAKGFFNSSADCLLQH